MGSIGSFGTARDVEEQTFDYFGTDIRIDPEIGELDYLEYLDAATAGDETASAVTQIRGVLGLLLLDEDVDLFWSLAKKNKQSQEDVLNVCQQIIEAITDRPTGESSDSSSGTGTTATTSGGEVSSRVRESLSKRPDLLRVVEDAAKAV